MKYIFEVEDFDDLYSGVNISQDHATNKLNISVCAANIANEKLNALIESCPKVYCNADADGILFEWQQDSYPGATHVARLAFIKEITKEPCKHEPKYNMMIEIGDSKEYFTCKHCGIELKATWSEVK